MNNLDLKEEYIQTPLHSTPWVGLFVLDEFASCSVFVLLTLTGERAYKGHDHRTAFSQSHHWAERGEDQGSEGQVP